MTEVSANSLHNLWELFLQKKGFDGGSHLTPEQVLDYFEHPQVKNVMDNPVTAHVIICAECLKRVMELIHIICGLPPPD